MKHMEEYPFLSSAPRKQEVRLVVLHSFALPVSQMLTVLKEQGLSIHYMIDEDGRVVRCVPEDRVAFHAGRGHWRDLQGDLNAMSIGIELYHPNLGQTPYAPKQIKVLIELLKEIMERYRISPAYLVGHSDIAPLRKADPGRAFPWSQLAAEGLGLWPARQRVRHTDDVCSPVEMLATIGYDVSSDEALRASTYAFKRRFLPEKVRLVQNVNRLIAEPCPARAAVHSTCPVFLRRLKQVYQLYSSCVIRHDSC